MTLMLKPEPFLYEAVMWTGRAKDLPGWVYQCQNVENVQFCETDDPGWLCLDLGDLLVEVRAGTWLLKDPRNCLLVMGPAQLGSLFGLSALKTKRHHKKHPSWQGSTRVLPRTSRDVGE